MESFEEVRRDIIRRRAARESEQKQDTRFETAESMERKVADAHPLETSPPETSLEAAELPPVFAKKDAYATRQDSSRDPMPTCSSTEAEALAEVQLNPSATKPYARRREQRARSRSNQTMLRRIRANFRNPASAKAALIAGEILAQPLALRSEGDRRS